MYGLGSSAQTPQARPDPRPGFAGAGAALDRLAALVVVGASGVADPRFETAAAEVAQRRPVEADRDHGSRTIRRRAPVAERVVPAVRGGQPERGPVAID